MWLSWTEECTLCLHNKAGKGCTLNKYECLAPVAEEYGGPRYFEAAFWRLAGISDKSMEKYIKRHIKKSKK